MLSWLQAAGVCKKVEEEKAARGCLRQRVRAKQEDSTWEKAPFHFLWLLCHALPLANVFSLMTAREPEGTAWTCTWGGWRWIVGKDSSPDGRWALEHDLQGSGHILKPARVEGVLGQCSQTLDLNFEWSCVVPGVRLEDPHGLPSTQDILLFYSVIPWFHDSTILLVIILERLLILL